MPGSKGMSSYHLNALLVIKVATFHTRKSGCSVSSFEQKPLLGDCRDFLTCKCGESASIFPMAAGVITAVAMMFPLAS